MIKNKKIYEVPALLVTEIEAEDIIAVSGLIGEEIRINGEALGYDTIEIDF